MIAILVAIALALLGLTFVLSPLARHVVLVNKGNKQRHVPTVQATGTREQVQVGEREQAARTALQEVELDYQLGNISDEDYNTLRERYVRRALLALKARHEQQGDTNDVEVGVSRPAVGIIENAGSETGEETPATEYDSNEYDQHIDDMIEDELRRLREQGNKENDAAN
jgi:hypothetical protein